MCRYLQVQALNLYSWVSSFIAICIQFFRVTARPLNFNSSIGLMDSKTEDDLDCEYDSTWEDEDNEPGIRNTASPDTQRDSFHSYRMHQRNLRAAMDMQTYRHGYPQDKYQSSTRSEQHHWSAYSDLNQEEEMVNLRFYRNEIPSSPDNMKITEFHEKWRGRYRTLEMVHSYIQWLFPLQEAGMNYLAKVLTKQEIKEFRKDQMAKDRLVTSYELMLDFYGIKLDDKISGDVKRARNWKERFENLNRNTHNSLRITRILKCLGELGFKHYQAPLVKFFLKETLIRNELPHVKLSVMDYFLFAVRDKKKRRELIEFAFKHYEPKNEFVWCPKRIQRQFAEKSLSDLGKGKDSLPGRISGCDQEKETNQTGNSAKSSDTFRASSVPHAAHREIDQASVPHSGTSNGKSHVNGDIQGQEAEQDCSTTRTPSLQKSVSHEPEQEGTEENMEGNRVPVDNGISVDPLYQRSSVVLPPTVSSEITQTSLLGSGTSNWLSPLGDVECPQAEDDRATTKSLPQQELVVDDPEQEGTEANMSRNKPEKIQLKSRDVQDNGTSDATPAAGQGSAHEKENKEAMGGMEKDHFDRCGENIHDPATKKCTDENFLVIVDPQPSTNSNGLVAVRVTDTVNYVPEDMKNKGAESYEPAGVADGNDEPQAISECYQPGAVGVEISKLDGSAGISKSATAVSNIFELDKSQRPKKAEEEAASSNDADNVLSNPEEVNRKDDAVMCKDSSLPDGQDEDSSVEQMEIDSEQNQGPVDSTESAMEVS
ncbi:hypothetical protein GJAV_G00172530 [Gymnothorax javanicus]|nr:hypothetical protein GJAV_G00172530 [Gymnothorax javanicus]